MTAQTTLELADALRALRKNLASSAALMQAGKTPPFVEAAANMLRRYGAIRMDGSFDDRLASALSGLWHHVESQAAALAAGTPAVYVDTADMLLNQFDLGNGGIRVDSGAPTMAELFGALLAANAFLAKDASPSAKRQIDDVIARYQAAREAGTLDDVGTRLGHVQAVVQEIAPQVQYALLLATNRVAMLAQSGPDARLGETAVDGRVGDDMGAAARKLHQLRDTIAHLEAAAAGPVSPWRPFETAPKDGTEILTGVHQYIETRLLHWSEPHLGRAGWYDDQGEFVTELPNFWQPIARTPKHPD